ncbi:hypothetical protein KOI35_40020 [Actinoplanes bogorensis]|uniref:Uncharacterized protein n=1 Tax=Paractinoplanes bogorensis TaxID=1610840 RepID=A0ABS5Z1Y8_9ACTN|nr:hypothetical protein [Actinoplanes bogorensis]MBU2669714.1 hypothetical protein [Actinoplanes bogorensis]
MADPQPEETRPANGVPDPTRLDNGSEPSTVDAPARWSGSAAVPETNPKKPWWRRNQAPHETPAPGAHDDHWATTPAVDPWADQDTPWDSYGLDLEGTEAEAATPRPAPPLPPPTRIEPPAAPQPPPTRIEPPAAPQPPSPQPPPPQPPPPPPPVQKPTNRPPVPAPPPPTRNAPKLSRKERKARKRRENAAPPVNRLPVYARPVPPPPPWAAPRPAARPMPAPPRRKRRWGRRLALLGLIGVVCCCGGPLAWTQSPAGDQYPVSAALPNSFADLKLRDTEDTGPNGFAGVYRDSRGKRVTVFGETGFRLTPGSDVSAHLTSTAAEYGLKDVQSFDLGEFGAHEQCGVGRDGGAAVVVCAWADHGSLATVLLTRRSIDDSADLVARLRDAVLTPG